MTSDTTNHDDNHKTTEEQIMSRKEERYYYDILDKIELMIKEDLKMAETASPNNQPSTLHYHLGRISSVGIIRDFIREELMSEDEEQ